MKFSAILKLIFCILLSLFAGVVGAIYTQAAIPNWYSTLEKPLFNPPNWLFGPVWLTLYILMGIALFLVLQKKNKQNENIVRLSIIFFIIQLVLNAIWSVIFFGLNNLLFALLELIVLWIFIILTTLNYAKISKTAAIIMIPYLLWVAFAGVLNYFIWILNIGV